MKHGKIQVTRGDMRKGKERDAEIPGADVKTEQRAGKVGRHIPVRKHRSLGGSGSARGVDDGGQIAGADRAGSGVQLRVRMVGSALHQAFHGNRAGI